MSSFSDFPALQPPPGVRPNLIHPYNKGYVLIVVNTISFGLMTIFLVIRVYSKMFLIKKWSADDVTCFLAAIGLTAYYIISLIDVVDGPVGKHQWDVTVGEITTKAFLIGTSWLSTLLLSPILLFTKLTFLLLYFKIFKPFRWMRICCYLGVILTTVCYTAFWIAMVYMATPKPGQTWLSHTASAQELFVQDLGIVVAAVGLCIDIYLLILPIGVVLQLQLPWQRKLGVSLIFLTGLLGCIASALSTYFRVLSQRTFDTTWTIQNVVISAFLEPLIGVIVSCMPSTAKVFSHHVSLYEFFISFLSTTWFRSKRSPASHPNNGPESNANSLPVPLLPNKISQSDSWPSRFKNDASSSLRNHTDREIAKPLSYELNHLKSISTFIHGSNREEMSTAEDDRIHLKQEILQVTSD